MRLSSLAVSGLFGVFDHTLTLNDRERLTIVLAPNGYGKTALLSMTHALLRGRYETLAKYPFSTMRLCFDDGKTVVVDRTQKDRTKSRRAGPRRDLLTFKMDGEPDWAVDAAAFGASERVGPGYLRTEFGLRQVGPREWVHMPSGRVLSADEVDAQFGPSFASARGEDASWLRALRKSLPVLFIETQRLLSPSGTDDREGYRRDPGSNHLRITDCAQGLARKLSEAVLASASLAQSLDRTFPTRLVAGMKDKSKPPTDSHLTSRLHDLDARRHLLRSVGLLEADEALAVAAVDMSGRNMRRVMMLYIEDTEMKLAEFDDLSRRLKLMLSILGERFEYKTLRIDRRIGFELVSDVTGQPIPLGALSSGEQHELVLLYDLLLDTKQDTLLLIDEPELSLHVAWQMTFISDLLKISELSPVDTILATHSPHIINDRWDLAVELRGPERR